MKKKRQKDEIVLDEYADLKNKIILHMENGMTFKDSCVLAGSSEVTGHRLKALRQEEKERLEALSAQPELVESDQKELAKLRNKKALCESFESRVESAIIIYKSKLVQIMNVGSLKDWKAAHELLKQRFSEEWLLTNKFKHEGNIEITETREVADALQNIYKTIDILTASTDHVTSDQSTSDQDDSPQVLQE